MLSHISVPADFAQQCFETADDAVYAAVTWAIVKLQKLQRLPSMEKKSCRAQVMALPVLSYLGLTARPKLLRWQKGRCCDVCCDCRQRSTTRSHSPASGCFTSWHKTSVAMQAGQALLYAAAHAAEARIAHPAPSTASLGKKGSISLGKVWRS